MSVITSHTWSWVAYVLGVLFILVFMLTLPQVLGGRASGRAKNQPFESGVVSVGDARLRLPAKFYLVAMMFVIFDAEALYLYAYSVAVREVGWLGFVEAVVFVIILLAGLYYIVRMGVLQWAPQKRMALYKKATQIHSDGKPLDLAVVTRFEGVHNEERDNLGKLPAQTTTPPVTTAEEDAVVDRQIGS